MRIKIARSNCLTKSMMRNGKQTNTIRFFSTISEEPKPYKEIPGLSSLPVLGPLHHFLPLVGTIGPQFNFGPLAEILNKKYGDIVKLEGVLTRADMVLLFDPKHIDQVYRAEESATLRPGFETLTYYREVLRKSTYDGVYGLTTAQGSKWRDFRTKVNPALLKLKLVKFYTPGLEEIAGEMVTRIVKLENDEKYLLMNFDKEITKWSLESIALVGLGSRIGCLRDDLSDDHPAKVLIKCAQDFIDLTYKLEFLPSLWRYISTPNFRRVIKTYDLQWEVSKMFIEQARKRIEERGYDIPEEDKSIIEKLLAIDEKVAIMMANEMLLAGIDTVAFSATTLLYHLATNPDVQDKVRQEVRSADGSQRYLKACLKESLRICPVVPASLRRTSKEHIVGGYRIPEGVEVIAPNEYLSKLEKHYPRPLEFVPERWLVGKTDPLYYGNTNAMITRPFGFGVRSCIGRRIAELEIEIFVKKLLEKCKVSWTGPPLKVVAKVLNTIEQPFPFKFELIE